MEVLTIVSGIASLVTLVVFFVMASNLSKLLKQSKMQNYYLSKIAKTNEDIVLKKEKIEYYELAGKIKIKMPHGSTSIVDKQSWEGLKKIEGIERIPFGDNS